MVIRKDRQSKPARDVKKEASNPVAGKAAPAKTISKAPAKTISKAAPAKAKKARTSKDAQEQPDPSVQLALDDVLKNGMSVNKAANKHGCGYYVVYRILRKNHKSWTAYSNKNSINSALDKATEAYEVLKAAGKVQSLDLKKIAAEEGVSYNTLYYGFRKKYGYLKALKGVQSGDGGGQNGEKKAAKSAQKKPENKQQTQQTQKQIQRAHDFVLQHPTIRLNDVAKKFSVGYHALYYKMKRSDQLQVKNKTKTKKEKEDMGKTVAAVRKELEADKELTIRDAATKHGVQYSLLHRYLGPMRYADKGKIQAAFDAASSGALSWREASKVHGVSYSTLYYRRKRDQPGEASSSKNDGPKDGAPSKDGICGLKKSPAVAGNSGRPVKNVGGAISKPAGSHVVSKAKPTVTKATRASSRATKK